MSNTDLAVVDPYAGVKAHQRLLDVCRKNAVRDTGLMSRQDARKLREERASKVLEKSENVVLLWRSPITQTRDEMLARIIQIKIAQIAGIDFADLFNPRCRANGIAGVRHVAYAIIYRRCGFTCDEIGRLFGKQKSASVAAAIRKCERLNQMDNAFADFLLRCDGEIAKGLSESVQ